MDDRGRAAFFLLIIAQGLHSIEEFHFRLFDALPTARWIAEAIGPSRAAGFLTFNSLLVLFGLWCWFARVRPAHRFARGFAWFWALLEIANGLGHVALAAAAGGYFPGLATAPLLLGLGGYLALRLARARTAA